MKEVIHQSNTLLDLTKKDLNYGTKEIPFNQFSALGYLLTEALLTRNYAALSYFADMAQRMQSPAFIKNPEQRATIQGMGIVANYGAEVSRPMPKLNDTQFKLLREISENRNRVKTRKSSTLGYLRTHNLVYSMKFGRVVMHDITPYGQGVLEVKKMTRSMY